MTQGIYCLYYETDDSKYYVGKSLSGIESRYTTHCTKLAKSSHGNYLLQKAYNICGTKPSMYILEECTDANLIDSKEIYWISKFEAYGQGFNLTVGGEGSAPGADHPKAIYTDGIYYEILEALSINDSSIIDVARKLKVDYNIVTNIAMGTSHMYLKEKYPEAYLKMIAIKGTRTVGGRCSKDPIIYENIFKDLANTTEPMQVIADRYNVSLNIVLDINKGYSHEYLHEKFPNLYKVILANRGKQIRFSKIWPKVVSPDEIVYEIVNTVDFCKSHALDSGGLSRLLNGKQQSTKGWKLHAT